MSMHMQFDSTIPNAYPPKKKKLFHKGNYNEMGILHGIFYIPEAQKEIWNNTQTTLFLQLNINYWLFLEGCFVK